MNQTLSLVCVGIRTLVVTVSIVAMFAGCQAPTPSGPTTNVNGDGNTTVVGGSGQDSKINDVSNPQPAPIVPVVVTPAGEEPA